MSKTKRARYQVYLDVGVAKDISKIGRELGVTRSQLVRDAMSSLVNLYRCGRATVEKPDYNLLFKLSGIINIPSSNSSARVDDIYMIDEFRHQHGVS